MADCGATGSALDRTVRAMGGGQHGGGDASKVLGSLLGQVSLSDAAMPQAAPHTLVMPPYNVTLPLPEQQQHMPSAVAAQQQQQHAASGMMQQHHMVPHSGVHHPAMAAPQMNHPYMQMAAAAAQQQQMMMMMNMQMQQQQQMILAQQQQQQAQAQQQQQQQQQQASSQTKPAAKETHFWDEKGLDQETQDALREHLESLGHEGLVQGAGIDELAAAWAEAEAAYEAEAVDHATNLATAIETPKEQYVFQHDTQEAPPNVASVDWMDEGMRHFRQGHVQQAIRCFETQLQHCNNDDSRAWRMLGKCHAENDQDREAILCLEQAVDRDPYATNALLALAVSHVNELNHQRALSNLKAWITHNPKYAGMELTDDLYGDTTTTTAPKSGDAGAFDEVQRLLLRALEYDPSSSAEILQTLGVTCKFSCFASNEPRRRISVSCTHSRVFAD